MVVVVNVVVDEVSVVVKVVVVRMVVVVDMVAVSGWLVASAKEWI